MKSIKSNNPSDMGYMPCPNCGNGLGYPVWGVNIINPLICLKCGKKYVIHKVTIELQPYNKKVHGEL